MKIAGKRLAEIIKKSVGSTLVGPSWKEVRYFHPEGKDMPNGSHYQRGYFICECKTNASSFVLDEEVHDLQYEQERYRGGVIVFPTDINAAEVDDNQLSHKIKRLITVFKYHPQKDSMLQGVVKIFDNKEENCIGAFSVGHYFKGKYIGDKGNVYNEKSIAIEINGLSSKSLLTIAAMIARKLRQETVLVKDLNKNKIYTAASIPDDAASDAESEK